MAVFRPRKNSSELVNSVALAADTSEKRIQGLPLKTGEQFTLKTGLTQTDKRNNRDKAN